MNIKHECAERIWRLDGPGTFQHVWTTEIDGKVYHFAEVTHSAEVELRLEAMMLEAFSKMGK